LPNRLKQDSSRTTVPEPYRNSRAALLLRDGLRNIIGRLTVGSLTAAYDQFQGKGRRVLLRLAFPNSDAFHDIAAETGKAQVEGFVEQDQLVKTVREVGLESGPSSAMTALLEADFFTGKNLPSGNQIADAFRAWLAAAKSKSTGQQVAAMLAADRELDFLTHQGVRIDDLARRQLQALGAEFVNDELGGGLVYAHSWLRQAKTTATPGPASDAVLLYEMERGFDETGMCSAEAEEFSKVIQEGESLLAATRALPLTTVVFAFHDWRCLCDHRYFGHDERRRVSRPQAVSAAGVVGSSEGAGALSRRIPAGAWN
jgi:hypothetical protein